MVYREIIALALLCPWGTVLLAADFEGVAAVKRKLTPRHVTANGGTYVRGGAVALGSDSVTDALAYERTHIAVFLDEDGPATPERATMEQRNRRFEPDFLVIPAGSAVDFPNEDPIFHNVFSLSRPKSFDLGNYPRGSSRSVRFDKSGVILVNCHLHSNMAAVVVVTPGPWKAIPDEQGRFILHNVPPGKHTLVAIHKTAGIFKQTVTVHEPRTAGVEILIPLDDNEAERAARASR